MFNQFTSTLRGVPQTVTGMSTTSRNYSTIGLAKKPFTELDSRYDLGSIGDCKRFANPNFVNKTNPSVYCGKLLVNYRSSPVEISPDMSHNRTQIEVGLDVLDNLPNSPKMEENLLKLSSSPVCISISPKLVISVTPESLPRKDRLNSDCCSDDSFIVFECSNEDGFEDSEEEEASDSESDEDSCSDGEDTDVDEVDFVRPRTEYKKVRFNDTPTVHRIVAWDFAYRTARKGHWEQYARDRCRFKRRIEQAERDLKGIFDRDHHDRMYRTRFSDEALAAASQSKEETGR